MENWIMVTDVMYGAVLGASWSKRDGYTVYELPNGTKLSKDRVEEPLIVPRKIDEGYDPFKRVFFINKGTSLGPGNIPIIVGYLLAQGYGVDYLGPLGSIFEEATNRNKQLASGLSKMLNIEVKPESLDLHVLLQPSFDEDE